MSTIIGEYTITSSAHSDCRYCLALADAAIGESILVGNPLISKDQWGLDKDGSSQLIHGATVVKTLIHRNYLEAGEKLKRKCCAVSSTAIKLSYEA